MKSSGLNRLVFASIFVAVALVYPALLPVQGAQEAKGPSCHLKGKSSSVDQVVEKIKAQKAKFEFNARYAYYALSQGQVPRPQECNATESWMCAGPEHACSRSGHKVEGDETANWHACECHHTCKDDPNPNDSTQGRKWDNKCKTRCSPTHCHCAPNPCGQT